MTVCSPKRSVQILRYAQDDRAPAVVILSAAKDLYLWAGMTRHDNGQEKRLFIIPQLTIPLLLSLVYKL